MMITPRACVSRCKFDSRNLLTSHDRPTVLNYEDIKNSLNRLDVLVNEYNKVQHNHHQS